MLRCSLPSRLCEQKIDGDGGAGENKVKKTEAEVVRITPGPTCRRENCQGRKRKAGLNGGISSRKTHRPHIKVGKDAEDLLFYLHATKQYCRSDIVT